MNILRTIALLAVPAVLVTCNNSGNTAGGKKDEPVWKELPQVTDLAELKHTAFVPTLENPVPGGKNVIYASAFLYTWDKVKEQLKHPVIDDPSAPAGFRLLNQSVSHLNSLADTEYTANAWMDGDVIRARAFFNKTLPFESRLEALDPIPWKDTKVAAFGMRYFDENAVKFTSILYYQDDDHFVLKFSPKDKQHEIILVKGLGDYTTLKEGTKLAVALVEKGNKEKQDRRQSWKYEISPKDIFSVPVIRFNIATNYNDLEDQTFKTADNKTHIIELAWQRTGFILDENGAVVESEAMMAVDSVGPEPVVEHPKKMVFDKPFLVIIKRTDTSNPYFVMKVENTELLTKK